MSTTKKKNSKSNRVELSWITERVYFFNPVVEMAGAFERFQSLTEQFAEGLAHSLQFDALRSH